MTYSEKTPKTKKKLSRLEFFFFKKNKIKIEFRLILIFYFLQKSVTRIFIKIIFFI